MQACTRIVESIILSYSSNPHVPIAGSHLAITLTLEGDAAAGIPSKRLLNLTIHSDLVMTFASIYGSSLTASSKSFRASARGIHLRGFLGFTGHPNKTHQYLFVNGHRIDQSGIMDVVREVYRNANVLTRDMDDEEEIGPRGGKRVVTKSYSLHPVFLLHLSLPRDEVDLGLEPLKSIVLFKVGHFPRLSIHSLKPSAGRSVGSKGRQKHREECLKFCRVLLYRAYRKAGSAKASARLIYCQSLDHRHYETASTAICQPECDGPSAS